MKPKSTRQLKVEQLIKKAISEIFLREGILAIKDVVVTVTEADVSPDIKNAKIFIDILGNVKKEELVAQLNKSAGYFRHKLVEKIISRTAPEIKFYLDDTAEKAQRIEDLINSEAKNFK